MKHSDWYSAMVFADGLLEYGFFQHSVESIEFGCCNPFKMLWQQTKCSQPKYKLYFESYHTLSRAHTHILCIK